MKTHNLSKNERRKLKRKQRKEKKQQEKLKQEKEKRKKTAFFFILIIVLIVSISYLIFITSSSGRFDDFAKCLKDKNITIYGNDYCKFTQEQMRLFGNSFKYVNYVRCADNQQLCNQKGVKITPTWEINNQMHSGVQTLEQISKLSECELKGEI